jgi:hypothetical protein
MTGRKYIWLVFSVAVAGISCQKELSFEGGNLPANGAGMLSSSNGDCLPKTLSGNFKAGIVLNDSNRLQVEINVTQAGPYLISTDTVNGYYFSGSGNFTSTGIQSVSLQGNGIPLAQGINVFTVKFNNSSCTASVNVSSTSSSSVAEYSLQGAGGNCLGAIVNGTYISSTVLTASNTIVLNVNVTRTGSYSITTTVVNGISFSVSGNFTTTGVQTVTLQGNGTPVNTGTTTISIPAATGNCSVNIDVITQSVDDYFPRTTNSNWTYEIDDNATDTARFFVIQPQYTISGNSYRIFMVTSGITVDSSGYYRKSGSEYFRYRDVGDFIGFDSALWREYKFLDDAAPVGANWKSEIYNGVVTIGGLPPQPMTVRFSTTVLSKLTSMNFITSTGQAVYNDIIVIEEKYEQLIAGNWVDITSQVGSFKKYYAKNVGFIKYEALNGSGSITASVELKRYQVY